MHYIFDWWWLSVGCKRMKQRSIMPSELLLFTSCFVKGMKQKKKTHSSSSICRCSTGQLLTFPPCSGSCVVRVVLCLWRIYWEIRDDIFSGELSRKNFDHVILEGWGILGKGGKRQLFGNRFRGIHRFWLHFGSTFQSIFWVMCGIWALIVFDSFCFSSHRIPPAWKSSCRKANKPLLSKRCSDPIFCWCEAYLCAMWRDAHNMDGDDINKSILIFPKDFSSLSNGKWGSWKCLCLSSFFLSLQPKVFFYDAFMNKYHRGGRGRAMRISIWCACMRHKATPFHIIISDRNLDLDPVWHRYHQPSARQNEL